MEERGSLLLQSADPASRAGGRGGGAASGLPVLGPAQLPRVLPFPKLVSCGTPPHRVLTGWPGEGHSMVK